MPAVFWQLVHFRGAQALQNLHPLMVHYPIALLTASVPIYFLAWIAGRASLELVGLWLLELGTLGAAASVYTGWVASESVMIASSVRENILIYHRWLMVTVLVLSVILAAWAMLARPMPRRGRAFFMIGLVLMAAILVEGADYGGGMVYGYNAGGSLPQPVEFSQ